MKENNVKSFTLTAMFLAIMIILAVTPLGFIPIGPINATTMHIPVIIASIVLGPRVGAGLGAVFGVISLARATLVITPMSFVFSPFIANPLTNQGDWRAIIVAILPRILIGVVPYFVYQGLHHLMKQKARPVSLFIAGLAGSMTNTILVMNLIFFFFKDSYANVLQVTADALYGVILGIIFGSGLVEAIVAGLATMGVCAVLLRLMKK